MEQTVITTLSDITLVNLQNCPVALNSIAKIFQKISDLGVNVDMISLAPSHGAYTTISFTIDDEFSADASASIMKMIEKGKFNFTSSGTDALRKAVRDSLSNFIWNRTRTRPMIIPVVMEV